MIMLNSTEEQYYRTLWSVGADDPRKCFGLVAGDTTMWKPGAVALYLFRSICILDEYETHIDVYMSEATARRLIERLTRIVCIMETVRDLHHRGVLVESALPVARNAKEEDEAEEKEKEQENEVKPDRGFLRCSARLLFLTTTWPMATDNPDAAVRLVAAVTQMKAPGVVKLSFYRSAGPAEEHDTGPEFHMTEETARRLYEQLTRAVHQLETARHLYERGQLHEAALIDRQDLNWPLLEVSDTDLPECPS